MTEKITHSQTGRSKVSVIEHRVLVDISKSKKLAALANKTVTPTPIVKALVSESDTALQQARQLIDRRIQEIMNSFPEGKRNKLFTFRFGSVAAIQALEIETAFKKLAIDSHNLNMRLLASLNYHGDKV
jgi:hypothetical protein